MISRLPPDLANVTLLDVADMAAIYKVSPPSIYRLAKHPDFPQPVPYGGRKKWRPDQVRRHLGLPDPFKAEAAE